MKAAAGDSGDGLGRSPHSMTSSEAMAITENGNPEPIPSGAIANRKNDAPSTPSHRASPARDSRMAIVSCPAAIDRTKGWMCVLNQPAMKSR